MFGWAKKSFDQNQQHSLGGGVDWPTFDLKLLEILGLADFGSKIYFCVFFVHPSRI